MSNTQATTVRDDAEQHRYVIDVDGSQAGLAVYHLRGGRHFFVHTEIDDHYAGKGLGSVLIREALDDVRSSGGMVVPLCPFVASYIRRHPDYNELVDWDMLNRIESQ